MVDVTKSFVVYFLSYNIFTVFCMTKMFVYCKEFTKCDSRQNILLHLPHATGKFLKIAEVKASKLLTRSIDILRSAIVSTVALQAEDTEFESHCGQEISICHSRSTRDPRSSNNPLQMKSAMTYTFM